MAHFFFGVGNQLEGQLQFGLEIVMRLHVVTRDPEHRGSRLHEILVFVAELHGFGGAAGGIVFRVKVKSQDLTRVRIVGNFQATCGVRFKFRKGFVENDRHD